MDQPHQAEGEEIQATLQEIFQDRMAVLPGFHVVHKINPVEYGWTYTGSNSTSRVEFYKRDDAKMDYFWTQGTVKISLNHPTQGKTQMFRRNLNTKDFTRVCINPRAHTGAGYQFRR